MVFNGIDMFFSLKNVYVQNRADWCLLLVVFDIVYYWVWLKGTELFLEMEPKWL